MNNALFDRLEKTPKSAFQNLTPENATRDQETDQNGGFGTGEVSEAAALEGAKAAEISGFPGIGDQGPQATKENATASGNPAPGQSLGHLLNAKTAIGIVDSLLPALAVILFQYFFKLKINKREIQLNEQERAIIQLPLQNYLNSVSISFDSPLTALLITITAVYAGKFAEKGFTAYFDKRDQDQEHKEAMVKLKKELSPVVTKEAPVVNLNNLKAGERNDPPTNGELNQFGYTKEQMKTARAALVKQGRKDPNNRQAAAYLRQQETLKAK